MLTVLYCFFKGRKMPIRKIQFPKLLTRVKGLTHYWNISVAKDIKRRSNVLNKIALSYGDTHIELTFLQLSIITSLKSKRVAFSIVLIIQHRDYNVKPIRDGNSKRWGWGKENLFIFWKITQKALRGWNFGKMRQ